MLQKGEIVDRYRLDERLGAGAFGEVWRASQLADGEDVGVTCAVKLMRVAAEKAGSSARASASGWLDEVRNLVRVAGETIPRILEANVWNEHAYIAMELLPGTTLGARIHQGAIPWRRALFIADQIAQALEAAHQVGVVHRDLKPQNVVLVGPDRACVIDWGIASLNATTRSSTIERRPVVDVEMTDAAPVAAITTPQQRPALVGTPGYMAPEVYEGVPPAAEQDIFALGVVMYEMLAGRLPHAIESFDRANTNPDSVKAYRGALDKATMDYELVPLRERCPDVPSNVAALVDRLLAREPSARPRKLRDEIERAGRFPEGIPEPPYAGLVKLGPERAGLYYGQQDTIQHVLERLRTQRGVLLWGPSGSGKSSLALAGVAATMDRILFAGTDGWEIHVVRPREQELRLASDAAARVTTLGQIVVVDQLEEVVDLPPAEQETFCAAVLALLERTAPVRVRDAVVGTAAEVRLVATIRDDLEWRIDRELPVLRPLLERRVIVKGVDANFAKSIIAEPARALGFEVEGIEAVSREVADRLSADPTKLPVVQYALSEWWERRDRERKLLPAAAWKELGGVDGALSFVAERFYAPLGHEQQERVKQLFMQMFLGGRKQPLAESKLGPLERALVEELARVRLVGRREKQGSEPFYEVEHESLAQNWSRLAGWLAEAREDRALAEEIERDAVAYARDHDRERLWKRGRLAAALEMAERGRIALSSNATDFLHHAKRQERRRRVVLAGTLGVVLAVLLAAGYIVVLSSAAEAERDQAVAALAAAKEDRAKAEDERKQIQAQLAVVQSKVAEAETKLAKIAEAEQKAARTATELEAKLVEAKKQTEQAEKKMREAKQLEARTKAICGVRPF